MFAKNDKISNETEYDLALNRVDELMEINPEIGTNESNELEKLVLLIKNYEDINWNIQLDELVNVSGL